MRDVGPRARHAVRRRRPHREAVPETLGITLDEALEQSPELRARHRGRRPGARSCSRPRASSRASRATPRTHAAGVVIGNRPLIETGAALPRREVGRRDHAVRHALRREDRADQVRLPRAAHAHRDRRRRAAHPRERPARTSRLERIPLDDDARPTSCSARATPRACSRSSRRGMTDLVVKLKPRALQGADPDRRALPARARSARAWSTTTSTARTGSRRSSTCCPSSRSSPPRRSA